MKLMIINKKGNNVLLVDLLITKLKDYYDLVIYEKNENEFVNVQNWTNSLGGILIFLESLSLSELLKISNFLDEKVPFIFISSSSITHRDISNVVSAIKNRKIGWFSSNITFDKLKGEIDRFYATNSLLFLCDELQKSILENVIYNDLLKVEDADVQFTKLEEDIINASINGDSIKEIAQNLKLSPNTVAVYRSKMLKKTKFKSMNQLVQHYLKQRKFSNL